MVYPKNRKSKHGMARKGETVPEYWVWAHMIQRCENPNDAEYKNYGARGIAVCAEWHDFQVFFADMGSRPTPKHTLDRRDNERGYFKDNCRWITQAEQNRNHRRNRWVEWDGQKKLITEWSRELFNDVHVISSRLYKGWTIERALTTPLDRAGNGWANRRRAS